VLTVLEFFLPLLCWVELPSSNSWISRTTSCRISAKRYTATSVDTLKFSWNLIRSTPTGSQRACTFWKSRQSSFWRLWTKMTISMSAWQQSSSSTMRSRWTSLKPTRETSSTASKMKSSTFYWQPSLRPAGKEFALTSQLSKRSCNVLVICQR